MAHMIDMSNNRANIAYVGVTPWHGLGQALTPGADLETWRREAGLSWEARRKPVQWRDAAGVHTWDARHVLFRSDTEAPLSIVSDGYNVVQPSQVLNFFGRLAEIGGFTLETAGVLSGGARIWALASVGDGAPVVKKDLVKPYVLLATSFDGSMATVARFTTIRVVCHNTLSATVGTGPTGKHAEAGAQIKIWHSERFDPDAVRQQLGIFKDQWERFQILAGMLAAKPFSDAQADQFFVDLIRPHVSEERDVRETAGYRKMLALFQGGAIGAALAGRTAWGAVNAVTEYVDHQRGRSADTRLNNAWFGGGNEMKQRAAELALAA